MINLGNQWDTLLGSEFKKDYYIKLRETLKEEYASKRVYPSSENIFNALRYTDYDSVKAVIIGQDPYHGEGQAHGLAFSVQKGVKIPPSLVNIYKELNSDIGFQIPSHGCLKEWAKSGVLLLNAVLTVREGEANSHKNIGWTKFTDEIISILNDRREPVIFLLWGRNATEKIPLITNPRHYVLTAAHPSPLSAYNGFFGCKHFSKTNAILEKLGKEPIDWQITD